MALLSLRDKGLSSLQIHVVSEIESNNKVKTRSSFSCAVFFFLIKGFISPMALHVCENGSHEKN